MIKYLVGLALALLVVNVLTFKQWQNARAALAVERVRVEQLDGQLTALNDRIARAATVRRTGEQHRIEVKHAANKTDWGSTAVPADVVRVLCERANCAPSHTVPPSDD